MDRDTIKNLLMTTSVLAIIAGSGQEAKAISTCTENFTGAQSPIDQTTNVNCIVINNAVVTGDVTIAASANLGLPTPPATTNTNTELRINGSTISGAVVNNGTITGNVQNGTFDQLVQYGIRVTGGSTVMNGVTNGATTGVIHITVVNTFSASTATGTGAGIKIDSSVFAGNVVNHGDINVNVSVDPTATAIAHATGMGVKSTSFVGNVVNTAGLTVAASAMAGSGTTALATSRARGILIGTGQVSGTSNFQGAGTVTTALSALFRGNITNTGVINALAVSTAIANAAAPLGAAATGIADGILVNGRDVIGTFTAAPSATGTFSATVSNVFTGNITNNNNIVAGATAWATNGEFSPVAGTALATSFAHAYGIRLLGDEFTGTVSSGSTSPSLVTTTIAADFAANITNTDLISATALSHATAFSSAGTAQASAFARAVGIEVNGADVVGNVNLTGAGNITNTYNGTYAGNISNSGNINAAIIASATAISTTGGTALAQEKSSALGISFLGANFDGNIVATGAGNLTNNLNATFLGNVTNSGGIAANGFNTATAINSGGTAAVVINSNAAGISVIGGAFEGNVLATGIGTVDNVTSFTFSGNITNTSSGVINATDTAVGIASQNVTGGEYNVSVLAKAEGIRLIGGTFEGATGNSTRFSNFTSGVLFTGNIGNAGTIQAAATAVGSLTGNNGSVTLSAGAIARGIEIVGAVGTSRLIGTGTFSGNVSNTGKIFAFATAIGRTTNVAALNTPFFLAQASAEGIRMELTSASGAVVNTGSINAYSTAVVTVNATQGSSEALARADGIDVRASTFTGTIGNSAGIIRVFATAVNNDVGTVSAEADANGIYANSGSFFSGNIGNTGLIVVTSNASVTPSGGTAIAVAAGISLLSGEDIVGTVSNGTGGIIDVHSIAQGNTAASATATGIAVDATAMFGDVVNNGTITASASATAISGTTATASAHAAGIHVGDAGGPFMSSFVGNINNTGVMVAFATATATNFAAASAEGILVANTDFLSGHIEFVSFVSGNILNSGTIAVGAFASAASNAYALAAGMLVAASTFSGKVTNSGTIFSQAGAAASTALSGSPTATADAFGIAVLGGTGAVGGASTFAGDVLNSGTVTVTSTATSIQPGGTALAHAAGILMAGSASADNFSFSGISTISGSVTNEGLIMSTASAVGDSSAVAAAFGIEVLFSTFVGAVANTGTLVNVSTFSGSVGNAGTITATALATVTDGSVTASAGGIVLAGARSTTGFQSARTFGGNVTNSGLVWAFANAQATTGTVGTGSAIGILLQASTVVGSITNTSTGVIVATANALVTSSPTVRATASVFATGIGFFASTFLGNVRNAGTIMATGSASASGSTGNAFAFAAGIDGGFETLSGNVLNTGFIGAYGTAVALGNTSALAVVDVAGIDLTGFLAIGTVANTGTLVNASTFTGNVKNAGTIMAIGTAIATSHTAAALAFDPATGIRIEVSSFFGVVQSSGLIVAEATATATGTGNTSAATANALAAGIAINAVGGIGGSSNNLFPTSFFSGAITNAGTIMVNAIAHATAGATALGHVSAGATGIRVFSSIVGGNISNSGFIQATATAINSSATNTGTAFAAGIHIGGVTSGIYANFAMDSLFVGNVTNSGTLLALASSTTQDNVYAAGIQVDTSVAFANIDNTSKGVISASGFVTGSGSAAADADGIYVHSSFFFGNVTNEGTVMASALATNLATPNAFADGIDLRDIGVFEGNVGNKGLIMASASALNGTTGARAEAVGILIEAGGFSGNVTNDGTISAFATAQANSGAGPQIAFAAGIVSAGSLFIGNINNTGLVMAKVSAPGGGGNGTATGIYIGGRTFSGGVSNSGTVMASADGTGMAALGIAIGSSTFSGNLNNSGLIIAAGDATGIYSFPGTFLGAINNTGTVIGTGGTTDRGIRVIGPSITQGINNSGTVQGGFASVDLDQETGPGTNVNNMSGGLLKGDVRLSSTSDNLNVFGGSTVMGNISGNVTGGGPIGNFDTVNFDLMHDGFGGTLGNGVSVYQYKITNVDTVNLLTGTLILDDQDIVGTVTLGPGNIDPVGTYNQSSGSTLGLVVDAGHPTTLGPTTPPTVKTITLSTGAGMGIGSVTANTVNIGTGATFKAFEEADYYANTNIYPDVVVGLGGGINGNYLNDGTHVLSNSPLFNAFMDETSTANHDTLILTRRSFSNPLGVGLTPNEKAAGHGLDGLYNTGNSTAMAVIPSLFAVSAANYAGVLKSLDGETILERPDLWQTVLDSILHRLSLGEGFNGQGVAGAMLNHGPIQVASAGLSDDDGLVAQTTPMPGPNGVVRPWSVWMRGYGVFGSGPSTINATSFDETRYGGVGGIDYHVTDNLLVGGVFNYAHGEVNLDAPTPAKNKQDAYQFAAYGKYQQGPWYVNAIVGGGFTDNTESRQVLIPMPATVNGSYNGESFTAYGEAGWDLYPVSNVKFTPLVGVGYNWLRYDAFQESGSPSALHVNSATTDNLYTALGARAQTAINIGTAAPLVPEVRVVWEHEFLDANQEMNAAFGGASLFNVQGSKFSRESVIAGVGISNNVAPDLKLFLDYDAKIQGGYSAHAVSAGFRWAFGGSAPPPPPSAPPPVPAAQPAPPPPAQAQTFVVYFDFDKSALTPEAMGIIKQAAAAYKQTGAVNIKVDGYTDLAGTAQYNVGLSKRRADVVRSELVKDGVPNNAVQEAWHGKDNPAVPTPDGVREPRNRRATIMLP